MTTVESTSAAADPALIEMMDAVARLLKGR